MTIYGIALQHIMKNFKPERLFFILSRAEATGMLGNAGVSEAEKYLKNFWNFAKFEKRGYQFQANNFYGFELGR